jgi:hypothetical protein
MKSINNIGDSNSGSITIVTSIVFLLVFFIIILLTFFCVKEYQQAYLKSLVERIVSSQEIESLNISDNEIKSILLESISKKIPLKYKLNIEINITNEKYGKRLKTKVWRECFYPAEPILKLFGVQQNYSLIIYYERIISKATDNILKYDFTLEEIKRGNYEIK